MIIGRETFVPCMRLGRIRFAMKFSKDKVFGFLHQKYINLFAYWYSALKTLIFISFTLNPTAFFDGAVLTHNSFAKPKPILPGAYQLELYLNQLKDKKVAIVANQTSCIEKVHLLDTLLKLKVNVVKIFSPEHGFRGQADAGESISDSKDKNTGIPVISLYGDLKKPSASDMEGIDVVVFDIQDVGVRFYTYISTLHYVMESCAIFKKKLILLDRPNPNANYVDGPILEKAYTSFVGMHPVPIVYGMTIGEYGQMINGQYWLPDSLQCDLSIIPIKNYKHTSEYKLPIPPSPNLKSNLSIQLYPSLCLFEGTTISVGRGTQFPFEVYGHPQFPKTNFSFMPVPQTGAKHPLHVNQCCNGYDLYCRLNGKIDKLNLSYLIQALQLLGAQQLFADHGDFFNLLAGTGKLKEQLISGMNEQEIRATWQPDLNDFLKIRSKYLIYP